MTTLPQGQLHRVTDARILPIGIDNVGVDWRTGVVLSSPQGALLTSLCLLVHKRLLPSTKVRILTCRALGMLPRQYAGSSVDSVLAKRAFILRSFRDLLKSGWLLFSWDFDWYKKTNTLLAQKSINTDASLAGSSSPGTGTKKNLLALRVKSTYTDATCGVCAQHTQPALARFSRTAAHPCKSTCFTRTKCKY